MRKYVIAGLAFLLFAAAGLHISSDSLRTIAASKASVNWPATEGRITAAWIETYVDTSDGSNSTVLRINYGYRVDGQEYTSGRPAFGFWDASLEDYPVGKRVLVYYDPRHPNQAVLEPGRCSGCHAALAFGVSLPFVVSLLCYGIYRLRGVPIGVVTPAAP